MDINRSDKSKKKVARGATLYSNKTKKSNRDVNDDPIRRVRKRISKIKMDTQNLSAVKVIKDPKYLSKVIDLLGQKGIEVTSYKEKYIIRRIKVRLGRLRIESYKDYYEFLVSNQLEIKDLQESLSINVTRFFRNRDTFELIKDKILPELVVAAIKTGRSSLSFWSAGCAVGAEPYSLAILTSESILSQIAVKIRATDVKSELLTMAKNGVYADQYLAEMKENEIKKYFHKSPDNDFSINQSIKKLITFVQHDLMKDPYSSNYDLIICRNVLIYVDRDAQVEIITKFIESLRPGGILVLGRTETLFGDWRTQIDIVSTKHRIYQKKMMGTPSMQSLIKAKKTKNKEKTKSRSKLTTSEHQNRLDELRNFRKTFEERRRLWSNRETSHDYSLQRNKSKISPDIGSRNRFSSGGISKKSTPRTSLSDRRRKKLDQVDSQYKSILIKSKPTRISTIRKDWSEKSKQEKSIDKIKFDENPEEIYRKLKARKRLRDAKRKSS